MRLRLRVRGHVQGIGYRYYVRHAALTHHLTGWVRNCSNGNVELEVQGEQKVLVQFMDTIKTGHPWARVNDIVEEKFSDQPNEKEFEIKI